MLGGHPVVSQPTPAQPVLLFGRTVTVGVGVSGRGGGDGGGVPAHSCRDASSRKPGTHFGDVAHPVPHNQQRVQQDWKLRGGSWEKQAQTTDALLLSCAPPGP